MANGFVKLVKVLGKGVKVYNIPQRVFVDLYVVQRMQLCSGIREDILIKVIDNTKFERKMLGEDNYDEFFKFMG